MQRQIRNVGIGLVVALLLVFGKVNQVQVFDAREIADNNANIRSLLREYSIKRGDILTRNNTRVAVSRRQPNKRLKYLRTYPGGELYGHITGWYSINYGESRIESAYHRQLLGEGGVLTIQNLTDRFLGEGEQGDDVQLTISDALQETARDALGNERGAVVALDPRNGEVLAMWSNPSFDPTPLASHTRATARSYWQSLRPSSTESPLRDLTTNASYPPGSTFKVLTAAAALESGRFNPQSRFPDPERLDLPLTDRTLTNFTRTACVGGGSIELFTALEISCDTTFAMIGLRIPGEIHDMAESLGFNEPLPFDVGNDASNFPDIPDDEEPLRAYAGIGQGDVRATPLQMAVLAATVANGGDVPRPRLVKELIDPSGATERVAPETMGRAFSETTANQLTDMMVAVVASGTGTAAQLSEVEVAGKTGTAQTGIEGENPHTWFIAFAPARNPRIAVAVIVENGGSFGSEATGGAVAAPIARAILEADRQDRGW